MTKKDISKQVPPFVNRRRYSYGGQETTGDKQGLGLRVLRYEPTGRVHG